MRYAVGSEFLNQYETRSKAAIALVFDPTTEPAPCDREAELARRYRQDSADLVQMVKDRDREIGRLRDLVRSLSANPFGGDRGTGRTTRMILRGLIAMSEGSRVMIVSCTAAHATYLRRFLLDKAEQFGIPLTDVVAVGKDGERTGFRGVTLVDHSVLPEVSHD